MKNEEHSNSEVRILRESCVLRREAGVRRQASDDRQQAEGVRRRAQGTGQFLAAMKEVWKIRKLNVR
jgi:hypothetical protein